MNVPFAVGYVRVSTEGQQVSGLGLDAQRAAISTYAKQRQVEVEWVTDVQSGRDISRPGLQRALELLRTGQAGTLIVAKLDRLSRSLRDFANLLELSRKQQWQLVALDLGVDTSTPGGELVASVVATVAQYERRIIGERTSVALQHKKARGIRLGRPSSLPPATLRLIKSLRSTGGMSFERLARTLNDRGVPTAANGSRGWTAVQVRRALASARLDDEAASARRRAEIEDPERERISS